MANLVFAISRTFGSGGRIIGHKISEMLSCDFYDKELIKLASIDSGINERLFSKADENKKPGLFKSTGVYRDELITPDSSDFVSDENLFNYQAKIVKGLALAKNCVIVGRCSDYVLRNEDINLVKVFIHAPEKVCVNTVMEMYSLSEKDAAKRVEKIDKARSEYYKYYTGNEWDDVNNFDICLDSSVLGYDKTAKAIIEYAKLRFES